MRRRVLTCLLQISLEEPSNFHSWYVWSGLVWPSSCPLIPHLAPSPCLLKYSIVLGIGMSEGRANQRLTGEVQFEMVCPKKYMSLSLPEVTFAPIWLQVPKKWANIEDDRAETCRDIVWMRNVNTCVWLHFIPRFFCYENKYILYFCLLLLS